MCGPVVAVAHRAAQTSTQYHWRKQVSKETLLGVSIIAGLLGGVLFEIVNSNISSLLLLVCVAAGAAGLAKSDDDKRGQPGHWNSWLD